MKNRFGLFVHWGLYSIPAFHEQALARGNWEHADYEALATQFNPDKFDPEKWVLLAKDAGMEYLCFTTKHHDGFCMWDTKQTDYNIMHTPYGKDVLAMLADACKKHGIKLSLYYSNPDWYHPNAYNPLSSHQWKAKYPDQADMGKYIAFIKAQITELLTNYGDIYTLFWDIPPKIEDPSINELARKLQPHIFINDRGFDAGDFATPERSVPDGTRFPTPTEACQSVGEQSWGYRAQEDYYSAKYLMSSIDKIMAMGGSYLLNIGPMADGTIPAESEAMVRRIGKWYNAVSNSLEDTLAADRTYTIYGNQPHVAVDKDGVTYFHFYNGIRSSAITFKDDDLPVPTKAVLCNSGQELPIRYDILPMITGEAQVASKKNISITNIPVDDYPAEPIVIAVYWN